VSAGAGWELSALSPQSRALPDLREADSSLVVVANRCHTAFSGAPDGRIEYRRVGEYG
jgi:hypothetical protein